MSRLRLSPPLLCLLPGLALVPVVIEVLRGIHGGGLETWSQFLLAAAHPSGDPLLLASLRAGLQVTVTTALVSWGLSTLIGLSLGVLSSDVVWSSWRLPFQPAPLLRSLLTIPRSIHELLWGLLLLQVMGLHPWVAVAAITIPYAALVARVVRDQVDTIDRRRLTALLQTGASPPSALLTSMAPPLQAIVLSYGGYRLECALRSATLLGVFGLGGIGTELKLTLQSLQFNECWSGLWLLIGLSIVLEQGLALWRRRQKRSQSQWSGVSLLLVTVVAVCSGGWGLHASMPDSGMALQWMLPPLPGLHALQQAAGELPWPAMVAQTLQLTVLAAGIAIAIPPLCLLLLPGAIAKRLLLGLWTLQRVVPAPLTLLMLLQATLPTLTLAALALGIQNAGVMGRLLVEGLDQQPDDRELALTASGAGPRQAWLLGQLSPQSHAYLAYGAYRTDVILRETVVVGLVGGTGLGWMLIESLSSFHWAAVILLIACFAVLTLAGERLSDGLRQRWLHQANGLPTP
ncbi:MAG: phosphonate ABC transporter [Synechococcus sp.]